MVAGFASAFEHVRIPQYRLKQEGQSVGDWVQCQLCKVSAAEFDSWLESKSAEELLEGAAEKICMNYVLEDKTVCHGAVTEMGDIILPVLAESVFSPDYFCGELLGYCSDSYYVFYAEDWVNQLLKTKPAYLADNNYVNNLYDEIAKNPSGRKTLKAVHISDPHVDYQYAVGSDSQCGGFLCCRASNGFPSDPKRQAGPWGAYNCDIPERGL